MSYTSLCYVPRLRILVRIPYAVVNNEYMVTVCHCLIIGISSVAASYRVAGIGHFVKEG